MKQDDGKDIWICGGAQIIQSLLKNHLIDEYHITVIPTLLGSGIRLFQDNNLTIPLELMNYRENNGMMKLIYIPRKEC